MPESADRRDRAVARVLLGLAIASATAVAAMAVASVATGSRILTTEFSFPGYYALLAASEAAVGYVIALRRARNPIGWWFLIAGVVMGVSGVAHELALRPDTAEPLRSLSTWVDNWLWAVNSAALTVALFRFPNGTSLSARWLRIERAALALMGSGLLLTAFAPGPSLANGLPNPYAIEALPSWVASIGNAPGAPAVLAATVSLIVRWRRGRGDERQQLKWLAFAVGSLMALGVMMVVAQTAIPAYANAFQNGLTVATLLIPLSIAIAITRYRLYDIDVLIERSVVYGALTAILAGAFVGMQELLKRIFVALTGEASDVTVVVSLFFIATLFAPLRARLQAFVDRRFKPAAASAVTPESPSELLLEVRALRGEIAALRQELRARR